MAQKIVTTQPDKPISGASLMRDSVAGRKTQFINRTTDSTGSVTLSGGQSWVSTVSLDLWPPSLPEVARSANNIVDSTDAVAWPYFDVFIDVDDDFDYFVGYGAALDIDQGAVEFHFFPLKTPTTYSGSTADTGTWEFRAVNNGSSSHTVYLHVTAKYIMYGDGSL